MPVAPLVGPFPVSICGYLIARRRDDSEEIGRRYNRMTHHIYMTGRKDRRLVMRQLS